MKEYYAVEKQIRGDTWQELVRFYDNPADPESASALFSAAMFAAEKAKVTPGAYRVMKLVSEMGAADPDPGDVTPGQR